MSASPLDAAWAFASSADWARVVPAVRNALAADPDDAMAHALLGLALSHLEQPREAVNAARSAVALNPELPFAHYALGYALLQHDGVAAAERAARKALRLDPDADAHALLAQTLARQRRWEEALDIAGGARRAGARPRRRPRARKSRMAVAPAIKAGGGARELSRGVEARYAAPQCGRHDSAGERWQTASQPERRCGT